MLNVAIVGATGYTAGEAAMILARHPAAELSVATSRSEVGTRLDAIHRSLIGRTDVVVSEMDPVAIAKTCDVVLCCLPHGASAATVRQLCDAGIRVIDFSADFRLSSLDVYQRWYGVTHPWPEKFGHVVYGMPEFFADQIAGADVVANPGCYPTSAILPLAPLVQAGLIETSDIIIDSKSGVSGAGRSAKVGTLYCETNESIAAYAIGTHRHGPEIDDLVGRITGTPIQSIFTPHLSPMSRGILSTIYVRPKNSAAGQRATDDAIDSMRQVIRDCYRSQSLIHLVNSPPGDGTGGGNQPGPHQRGPAPAIGLC